MPRDLDRVLAGLRGYLDHGGEITGIVALSTGHSNETYLLEGLDRILRTPPSEEGLLPPYDMPRQHAVFDALTDVSGAPPVPCVHELCTDPDVIGDAFFVMERKPGEAFEFVMPEWLLSADDLFRSELHRQWIEAVASVHRLEPLPVLGPVRTSTEEADRWRQMAADAGSDELRVVLEELVEDPPEPSGAPTAVHGDPKLANCLWHEGRLTALLDWEMSYNGEPLDDLGYVLVWFPPPGEAGLGGGKTLAGFWERKQVIAAWELATGRSASGVERHEALAHAKIGAILAKGAKLFAEGRSTDQRFALWTMAARQMAERAARLLER